MKNSFYNYSNMCYIVVALHGQLMSEVIVALDSVAIVGVTGLLAASPLIR
jgi:hypothetical protein